MTDTSMFMTGAQPPVPSGPPAGGMLPGVGGPGAQPPELKGVTEHVPMSSEQEEMELAMMVRQLFYKARDARRPLMGQWKKNYRVLNNKTWMPRAEPWMPAPEISNIWPIIASMVAWMTDQRPVTEVTPIVPPFSPAADFYDQMAQHMNACLKSVFVNNDLDAEIEAFLWDVATYGIGWTKTTWEAPLADGMGDSPFRRRDPFTIYPDPHARKMAELGHIIEASTMTMDDVDRAWPGSKARLHHGVDEDIDESPHKLDATTNAREPRVNLSPIGPATSSRFGTAQRQSPMVSEDQVVVVLEAWVRQHEIQTHKEDKNIPEGEARVYDRWKCIVVCNNTVLMNEWADDIYGHNEHPYDRMVLFETGEMYGPCLVQFLTSPQESINRLLGNMEQNIMLVGNPILYESSRHQNRGIRTNRPGQRVQGRKDEVGWLQPPTLHPDQINLIQYYEGKIETISGLSAIVRGFSNQSNRQSEGTMSSVQDSAFVRVRATLRNLERTLRGCARKQCANIAEFYTEPRMIAITGAEDGDEPRIALKSRHFYAKSLRPDKNMEDGDEETPEQVPLRFMVGADAGSEHPTSRAHRDAQSDQMFAMGAIDELELLKAKKWPNYKQVANRIIEAKAAGLMEAPGKRQATRS